MYWYGVVVGENIILDNWSRDGIYIVASLQLEQEQCGCEGRLDGEMRNLYLYKIGYFTHYSSLHHAQGMLPPCEAV